MGIAELIPTLFMVTVNCVVQSSDEYKEQEAYRLSQLTQTERNAETVRNYNLRLAD